MAKRKATRRGKTPARGRKKAAARRSAKRSIKQTARKTAPKRRAKPRRSPRLDRPRRTLDETVPTPPSSLNMNRRGSAASTGRAELEENRARHRGMTDVAGGDLDVDVEDAYFTGEETPGGDNSTPDQDVVDDIGKALGVQYEDNEELRSSDKVVERDKHRWELDPASAEDYKERK
jgi:hypothetical protein